MTHRRLWIACLYVVSLTAPLSGAERIDVAPAAGKKVPLVCGRRCILKGDGFGERLRIRIFRGSPATRAHDTTGVANGCIELDSLVGEVTPGPTEIDMVFHTTWDWLNRIDGQYKNSDYSFVLERIARPRTPDFPTFRKETLRISTNHLEGYFASAVHVVLQVPPVSPSAKRKSGSKKARKYVRLQQPPPANPRLAKTVDCEDVTFSKPVSIKALVAPALRVPTTPGAALASARAARR